MSRVEPFPEDWTVRRARDAYLAENGFAVEAYDAPWTEATFLGIRFRLPNTRRHRWAIMLHDLHHVATGFGTDLVGEGEISVWEVRDLRALGPYVGTIVGLGALMGLALTPLRSIGAWKSAPGTPRLFALHPHEDAARYEELLDMTVGQLRALLGVPKEGLARAPAGLHARAPRAQSVRA